MSLSYFSFSPDGRVIASGTHCNGVRFWNPATGEEMPRHRVSELYDGRVPGRCTREMLTYGPATGLFRWQVRTGGGSGVLRIGPPESLLATGSIVQMAHSRDGRVVGLAGIAPGALLMLRGSTPRIVPLGPQVDVRTIAVSPDGRWAATGSHNGNDAGVFVLGHRHRPKGRHPPRWRQDPSRLQSRRPMAGHRWWRRDPTLGSRYLEARTDGRGSLPAFHPG